MYKNLLPNEYNNENIHRWTLIIALIIAIFMVIVSRRCTVTYQPPILVPLKVIVAREGIFISVEPEIVTFLGAFGIETDVSLISFAQEYKQYTQSQRILAVRVDHTVDLYRLKPNVPIQFEAEEDDRYFRRVAVFYIPEDPSSDILLELETVSKGDSFSSIFSKEDDSVSPCAGSPKRLQIGKRAIVCTWESGENLILREGPGKSYRELRRLRPGAVVTITGPPQCDAETGWWYWPVRTRSGYTGWMAEGGDRKDPYFLCPFNVSE